MDQITTESKISEGNLLPIDKKNIKLEKSELGDEKSSQCNGRIAENNSTNLKTELLNSEVTIKNELSEGEASSGFETVSSVESNIGPDDLDLSSIADEDDFKVIDEIENELAFQTHQEFIGRSFYWKNANKTPGKYNHRNKSSNFNSYSSRRHDEFLTVEREYKYWQSSVGDKNYKYDRRDKKASEREVYLMHYSSYDHDVVRSRGHCRKSRGTIRNEYENESRRCYSRSSDHEARPRRSRSSDYEYRPRRSRSSDRNSRSRYSRSNERTPRTRTSSPERNVRPRSPGYKNRKAEAKRSGSFDKNSKRSNSKRISPPRKRRCFLKSATPVWKRLENRMSPNRVICQKKSRNMKRKKERTPFLVELERKLKEADRLKDSKKEISSGPVELTEMSAVVNNKPAETVTRITRNPVPSQELPVPEIMNQNPVPRPLTEMPTFAQSPAPQYLATYTPPAPKIPRLGIPIQYTFPTISLDNLPLVVGPTGVPVHITMTGEQIPHDMDGRRVPVGPNGYYLPLDPTGRLFPHIVSPNNQAVPVHMTEDGILRLPNSEPVPYGPPHKPPVNIDGRVIPIGPDSKVLFSCPNIPRQPPLNLLKLIGSECTPSETFSHASQTVNQQIVAVKAKQGQNAQQNNFQLPGVQNPSWKNGEADVLKKHQEKRSEVVLKAKENETNLGATPSVGGFKALTPVKLFQGKCTEEDINNSGSDMVLDSDDSDSASALKSGLKRKESSVSEILLSFDDEQDILKAICDTDIFKTRSANAEAHPKCQIIKRVQEALKSLYKRDYKSPVFGRFIISNSSDLVVKKSPNESPLLRSRILLPFLTPNTTNPHPEDDTVAEEKTEITFKFLPQKIAKDKLSSVCDRSQEKSLNVVKIPILTFDYAMQVDFTSVTIKNLNSKLAELEAEVVRLKNTNASLLDDYKNVQAMNEEKCDELRKAQLEIRERNKEIQALKRSIEKKGK